MKVKLLVLLLVIGTTVFAQEENLKMRFDFSNVSGSNVKDPQSNVTARVMSPAKVMEMGEYKVLDLGNGSGYLDLTASAGKIFAGMENHTISVYYRVNEQASLSGAGYFLWTFSTSATCSSEQGVYSAYRLNAQRIASSTGGYMKEVGYSVNTASTQGGWVHVAFTQSGTTGKLYINGELKASISGMPKNSTLYSSTKPNYCWIGRAPFSGDNYLRQTLVTDFCVYDRALTVSEIRTIANGVNQLDYAYTHGTKGNTTALSASIVSAKALISNPDGYLPGAVKELNAMVFYATSVVNGQFSQPYIDNVDTQLTDLIATTKSTKGIQLPTVSDMENAFDTNRGFIHPGGLHTKEDFDRVKAQLAAKNETVVKAYNVLKTSPFAQPDVTNGVTETVVRGGGVGENVTTVMQAAAKAYQCALRWKIEDNRECAHAAVNILMQWARGHKYFGGNSNYALAVGLQGNQFAQAAELLRDYSGWSAEDFQVFKDYMYNVWYSASIHWLRTRNGTWDNADKAEHIGDHPGHYWANWPLANAFTVISIGILLDDVFIYNQGMAYIKYDQVGTFEDPRIKNPLQNDGCNEFFGNLIVKTYDDYEPETGAYGQVGQTQEIGRDQGHATLAIALAVDIAHTGYNQSDDLFSYMNYRLAAGLEYTAAFNNAKRSDLPFTQYNYYDSGRAFYVDPSWAQTQIAKGETVRTSWGTVLGIYEGVKGVKMPFSEKAYEAMVNARSEAEIYTGGATWGYDHLGFSILMNTRDEQLAPAEKVPTELSPLMEYNGSLTRLIPSLSVEKKLGNVVGSVIKHNELGGLINTYILNNKTTVPRGETIKLMPQLPENEEDTGLWLWDTGETTRDITVTSDKSYIYRVTYTNKNGIESSQNFSIAVDNDCIITAITPTIAYDGNVATTDIVDVLYGQSALLTANPKVGWGNYLWSTGNTTQSITTSPITASQEYTVYYTNQGGCVTSQTFQVNMIPFTPFIISGGTISMTTETVIKAGESITLGLNLPTITTPAEVTWSNGKTGDKLILDDLQTGGQYTATFTLNGETIRVDFTVYVKAVEPPVIEAANYIVLHIESGKLLTAQGSGEFVAFEEGDIDSPSEKQTWFIDNTNNGRYCFKSLPDSLTLLTSAKLSNTTNPSYSFYFDQAQGTDWYALRAGAASFAKYWTVNDDGSLSITDTKLTGFPFLLIRVSGHTAIPDIEVDRSKWNDGAIYDLNGRRVTEPTRGGIYIINGKKKFFK